MNNLSPIPDRLTVIIGPPGAPPELKQRLEDAYASARDGDNSRVEEMLEYQKEVAGTLLEGGTTSCLARALETLTQAPVKHLEAYISWGFFRERYCATININLNTATVQNGDLIEPFLNEDNLDVIGSIIGLATKADWMMVNHITDTFYN